MSGALFALIREDHAELSAVIDRLRSAAPDAGPQKRALLEELRDRLARHARAEEALVYPLLAKNGLVSHRDQAEKGVDEHREVVAQLDELLEEDLFLDAAFPQRLDAIVELLRAHIDDEEVRVLPHLRATIPEGDLERHAELWRQWEAPQKAAWMPKEGDAGLRGLYEA